MGKPNAANQRWRRFAAQRTWGSETSQYPEEKKNNFYSLSSGERKGKSLNLAIPHCVRYGISNDKFLISKQFFSVLISKHLNSKIVF